MNKTAAIRSQARRAALTKVAQVSPQLIGALTTAAGGALGGSAVTGDDQSFVKRVGKAGIGAGLGYAGYKLMTDPKWQQGLSTGLDKARGLVAQLASKFSAGTKAAEAQQASIERAYVAGFCKAAEAVGIDPVVLSKQAGFGQLLGKGIGWLSRGGRAVRSGLSRYGNLMAGGKTEALSDKMRSMDRLIGKTQGLGGAMPAAGSPAHGIMERAMRQRGRLAGMLADEQGKVDLARQLTMYGIGAGAGTLGMGLANRRAQQVQQPAQIDV